jgi:hypothetical protein
LKYAKIDKSTIKRLTIMSEVAGKTYGYSINLNERNYFEADVRDSEGKSIWSVDTAGARELVEDGFVKNASNANEIEAYLRENGIIGKNDAVIKLTDAESAWEEDDTVEIGILTFDGFCDSHHSAAFEDAIEQLFVDSDGEPVDQPDEFYKEFTITQEMRDKYCALYVEVFRDYISDTLNIELPSLKFSALQGPRQGDYFNGPDQLFATVRLSEFKKLHELYSEPKDIEAKRKAILDNMSSHSGFHSFYNDAAEACQESDNVSEWFGSEIEEWDHNELGAVLAGMTGPIEDYKVLSSMMCPMSEKVNEIIWSGMSDKCRRIANDFTSSDSEATP